MLPFSIYGFISIRLTDVNVDKYCLNFLFYVDEVHLGWLVVQLGDGMRAYNVICCLLDYLVGKLHYDFLILYTTARCVGKTVGV